LWLLARFDFGTLDKKPAIDILLGMLDQGKDCADQLIVLGKGNKYLKDELLKRKAMTSPGAFKYFWVLSGIADVGDAQTIDIALGILGDGEHDLIAISAINRLGSADPATINKIINLAKDKSSPLHKHYLDMLGAIGERSRDAQDFLKAVVVDASEPAYIRQAAENQVKSVEAANSVNIKTVTSAAVVLQDSGKDDNPDGYSIYRLQLKGITVYCLVFASANSQTVLDRLAFYAEKEGYKGKVLRDDEMPNSYVYDGHDYSLDTIAVFFTKAEQNKVQLHPQETRLRDRLLMLGLLKSEGGVYRAGEKNMVVSFIRDHPRKEEVFIHELVHAFYDNPVFLEQVKQIFMKLSPQQQEMIKNFLRAKDYAVDSDEKLFYSEFAAYFVTANVAEFMGKVALSSIGSSGDNAARKLRRAAFNENPQSFVLNGRIELSMNDAAKGMISTANKELSKLVQSWIDPQSVEQESKQLAPQREVPELQTEFSKTVGGVPIMIFSTVTLSFTQERDALIKHIEESADMFFLTSEVKARALKELKDKFASGEMVKCEGGPSGEEKGYNIQFSKPGPEDNAVGSKQEAAKPLLHNNEAYGYFDANGQITIDVDKARQLFVTELGELVQAFAAKKGKTVDQLTLAEQQELANKFTGFIHVHEIFHQLVRESGLSAIDNAQEERMANIFAKLVFGIATETERQEFQTFLSNIQETRQAQTDIAVLTFLNRLRILADTRYEAEDTANFLLNLKQLGIEFANNINIGEIEGANIPVGAKGMSGVWNRVVNYLKGKQEKAQVVTPAAKTVSDTSKGAIAYTDRKQNFNGVDLNHFVWAMQQIVEGNKPFDFVAVAKRGFTKEDIDNINADTYPAGGPRLDVEIGRQNENPKLQSVLEAISNGLDAHGFSIGQFAKGIKQALDWLSLTGGDRVDVFSKSQEGRPYHLVIIRDEQGQYYISINEIADREFDATASKYNGSRLANGTIVKISVKGKIPRREDESTRDTSVSQIEIIEAIHKRFPFVTSVDILTRRAGESGFTKVNGFENIMNVVTQTISHADSKGRFVKADVTDSGVIVIDNGKGMDAPVIFRMFVPKKGSKNPQQLGEEMTAEESVKMVEEELKKVGIYQDKRLPNRISFSRNSEVVVTVDIPQDILPDATSPGGLMLEGGLLMDVPESRGALILSKRFQLAAEKAISLIVTSPAIKSDVERLKYINTLIIGFDGLIGGNASNAQIIKSIRAFARDAIAPAINKLRKSGVIILPYTSQFVKLDLKGKNVVYLHENIFDWQGAVSLKEIGGEVLPGIQSKLPIVVAPFTAESVKYLRFSRLWHMLSMSERLPMVRTDSFVAIPREIGESAAKLLLKKQQQGLSASEDKELASILERINIIVGEKVVTSYEVSDKIEVSFIAAGTKVQSLGSIDASTIQRFLSGLSKKRSN
ncbi:MAG: HEAT repeat domain-containing protein, partial [Candidatus Omnitrophica bacterium]|nr:HEAT repeat domain-containing protein [Candidatus Omnitrophota bacterium]